MVEREVRPLAALLAVEEPGVGQLPQVVAHRRLGQAEGGDELAGADGFPRRRQQVDDLHARRVSERPEERGGGVDLLVGERRPGQRSAARDHVERLHIEDHRNDVCRYKQAEQTDTITPEVRRFLGRKAGDGSRSEAGLDDLRLEARRGRALVEESLEIVVVLDEHDRVLVASRRARELLGGLEEGAPVPDALLQSAPLTIPYEVGGHRETILYARDSGDMAAYEELRAGFTAAVSHELRTPLARLLALLDSALLPGADVRELVEQAQSEVDQVRELIDDILFLSELESGHEIVGLGTTQAFPILAETLEALEEQAARGGVVLELEADEDAELPLRPRMIRVIVQNLAQNAIRYAGPGAHLRLSLRQEAGAVVLSAADDGVGVPAEDVPRLFERFYRSDRARASRGTGLGLAIVKHVVSSAGGSVEASGARGRGLTIRCVFPEG